MVRSVAGSTVLPPELIDYIVTMTDGVPLFIQEVTKNALESDLLCGEGDGQVVIDRLHSLAIRTTLQDLKGLKLLVRWTRRGRKGGSRSPATFGRLARRAAMDFRKCRAKCGPASHSR